MVKSPRGMYVQGGAILLITIGSFLILQHFGYDGARIKGIAELHRSTGVLALFLLMCTTTVVAPLTSMPLIPILAPILGPFTVGLTSFLAWTCGSIISFYIARVWGRGIVEVLLGKATLEKLSSMVSEEDSFLTIVLLRIVIPVDILSYALGLFTEVSFRMYISATMLGIVWFAFGFAYLGEALYSRNYVLFLSISVASVVILYTAWRTVRRTLKGKMSESKGKD